MKAERITSRELLVTAMKLNVSKQLVSREIDPLTLTNKPISAHPTSSNNHKPQTKDSIKRNPLPSRHRMMPSDNARQRHSVQIADSRTHSRRGVDDIAILEASVVRRQRVLDIKRHPIGFGRSAVDEQHDAEGDRVHNRKSDGEPDAIVPFFRIGACYQTAVEKQDRDFGAPAAD